MCNDGCVTRILYSRLYKTVFTPLIVSYACSRVSVCGRGVVLSLQHDHGLLHHLNAVRDWLLLQDAAYANTLTASLMRYVRMACGEGSLRVACGEGSLRVACGDSSPPFESMFIFFLIILSKSDY